MRYSVLGIVTLRNHQSIIQCIRAVSRLLMEVGILGWKLTLIRLASTFFFPPIAGWVAQTLFAGIKPG